jgi:hypothetical protein
MVVGSPDPLLGTTRYRSGPYAGPKIRMWPLVPCIWIEGPAEPRLSGSVATRKAVIATASEVRLERADGVVVGNVMSMVVDSSAPV